MVSGNPVQKHPRDWTDMLEWTDLVDWLEESSAATVANTINSGSVLMSVMKRPDKCSHFDISFLSYILSGVVFLHPNIAGICGSSSVQPWSLQSLSIVAKFKTPCSTAGQWYKGEEGLMYWGIHVGRANVHRANLFTDPWSPHAYTSTAGEILILNVLNLWWKSRSTNCTCVHLLSFKDATCVDVLCIMGVYSQMAIVRAKHVDLNVKLLPFPHFLTHVIQ